MIQDRWHLAIEITVKQIDQSLRRQGIGQPREAAHIGQPDRRVDRLGIAAANMAREHPLARIGADIGREQIAGDAIPGADLGDARQGRDDRTDDADLFIGEAA